MSWCPPTVQHPETFIAATPPWSDGKFDWTWLQKPFADTKIKPMDFDGVVERFGNFLVVESKGIGISVPDGQRLALERLYAVGCVTVLIVWGKLSPVKFQLWAASGFKDSRRQEDTLDCTAESMSQLVTEWRQYAESHRIVTPRKYQESHSIVSQNDNPESWENARPVSQL